MSWSLELQSFVGGDWRDGDTNRPRTNPADPSEVVASASLAGAEIAVAAVDAAATALGRWSSARILRYDAGQVLDPHGETHPSREPGGLLSTRREPVGVVTIVSARNFPLSIPAWKIAPAIAFGNTVVWRPAELVPLTAVHPLAALRDSALPDGVVNLVLGRHSEVGDVLTTHRAIDAATFTGSTEVCWLVRSWATEAVPGWLWVVATSAAGGYSVPATVVADVEPGHAVAGEEVFGSVLAVLTVDSFDEAVALANDRSYGLTASVHQGPGLGHCISPRAAPESSMPTSQRVSRAVRRAWDSGSGEQELGSQTFLHPVETVSIGLPDFEE